MCNREEWRDVVGFEGYYQVSNLGRVKGKSGKILTPYKNANGYLTVHARNHGKTSVAVHRMVKETFDPIQNMDLYQVDHINGKRDDESLENLRWVSPQQNTAYKINNQQTLHMLLQKILQKYGYKETKEQLEKLL